MIRKLGGAARGAMDSDMEEGFRVGDKVEARFKGGARWHPGRITEKNRDGTYDVRYEDGDEERRVESRLIRKLGGAARGAMDSDMEEGFRVGDKVEARFKGGTRWHPGRITEKNR